MPRIYMVRHGQAAAAWSDDLDPGLDALGKSQADAAADKLMIYAPLEVVSSPLKRALETSHPYAQKSNTQVKLERRVAEIPSPNLGLESRGIWLGKVMRGTWAETSDELLYWRTALIDYLCQIKKDTAVFSHFIAINVAVGNAIKDDRVVHFRPDNCSISILETDGASLVLIEKGDQAQTHIG